MKAAMRAAVSSLYTGMFTTAFGKEREQPECPPLGFNCDGSRQGDSAGVREARLKSHH